MAEVHAPHFELGTDGPKRILVGVDGTPASLRAGAYAGGMARRNGSELIVVHVAQPSAMAAQLPAAAGAVAQTQAEMVEEIRDLLVAAVQRLGFTSELVTRTGNPYRELTAVAEERQVELVVIGSSTRSGRRFVGSLAARMVRDAVWPVLVVP